LIGVLAQRLGRELTRGRQELRELSELHRRIVDHMPSGLLTVDRSARVSSFNQEAERITGYASRDVVGRPLSWLFPGLKGFLGTEAPGPDAPPGTGARDPRSVLRRAFTFEHPDDAVRHLGFSSATLRDDAGAREGTVIIFQDLTRIVEMEDQLGRSERLATVGQLAAGLAHEIRNPLASLSGSIELLETELPDLKDDARKLFGIVQRETERLNRLLTEFLHFARPEPREQGPVSVLDLWREIAALLDADPTMQVDLDLDISGELAVLGDADRLRQVFWNLLLNATEANPVDGRVHVTATPLCEGREVEVAVEDRGEGIPQGILSQVFDPFFTTKRNGNGLGLATVHRIVEAHGGRILVTSEEGKGTTVRIVLLAPGA
jgi:two-component system sensor histidine kinase PilS (NtrC family)